MNYVILVGQIVTTPKLTPNGHTFDLEFDIRVKDKDQINEFKVYRRQFSPLFIHKKGDEVLVEGGSYTRSNEISTGAVVCETRILAQKIEGVGN